MDIIMLCCVYLAIRELEDSSEQFINDKVILKLQKNKYSQKDLQTTMTHIFKCLDYNTSIETHHDVLLKILNKCHSNHLIKKNRNTLQNINEKYLLIFLVNLENLNYNYSSLCEAVIKCSFKTIVENQNDSVSFNSYSN